MQNVLKQARNKRGVFPIQIIFSLGATFGAEPFVPPFELAILDDVETFRIVAQFDPFNRWIFFRIFTNVFFVRYFLLVGRVLNYTKKCKFTSQINKWEKLLD
jgi:hypothetical protein